jgi:hypothetical protein
MAAIGGAVAVGSALSPQAFLRVFGVAPHEVTGPAAFGWRLFAVRTAFISGLAWRGDHAAREEMRAARCWPAAASLGAFRSRPNPTVTVVETWSVQRSDIDIETDQVLEGGAITDARGRLRSRSVTRVPRD